MDVLDGRVVRVLSDFLVLAAGDDNWAVMRQLRIHQTDLFELVPRLEAELGVVFSDPLLFGVRTYADLAVLAHRLATSHDRVQEEPPVPPPFVWTRAERSPDRAGAVLRRSGRLTGYLAETIVDDARTAGCGARLEVVLRSGASAGDVMYVDRALARARRYGVVVQIYRSDAPPADEIGGAVAHAGAQRA
jgi:hypothetical protein